jgi:Carboxypeptidase regulatory-like domain/TonB dependent receptor
MKSLSYSFALCLCLTFSSLAQEFRATLAGHVTDPSGALVPNASVAAVNDATHQTWTAATNGSGAYQILYILPGTYTVTVKANGFKTLSQGNVVIQAGEAPVLDLKLEVGTQTETVSVTDTAPLLDADNAVGNSVLTERELQDAPIMGRQIYNMLNTVPGSQFLQTQFGASGFSGSRGWDVNNNYTIGGGVQGYQQFTLNGTNITQQNNGTGTWFLAPNLDALQEVNVQSTNYDARWGRSSGGFVNSVMKNGTNQVHGDLYEYLQNGDLNANNFENNLNGIPTQDVKESQFGGTIGGPIIKDKVFYFAAFEGYVENIPFTTLTNVPPSYLRPQSGQGVNFTQSTYTIFDPTSTFCSSGGSITSCPSANLKRMPFPNDTIPASQINPIGAAMLNLFPQPNSGSGLFNNYIANVPDMYRYWQPMGRVDYDTSDNTRWYSLFAFQHGTEFRNTSGFPPPAENGNINTMRQYLVAAEDYTHTFSPTLLLDVKLSFTRFRDHFPDGDLSSTATPGSIGLTMPKIPTTNLDLLPEVTFSEIYPQVVGNTVSNDVYNSTILDGDLTKTWGRHTLHFGGEVAYYQWGTPNSVGRPNGYFAFGTDYTQANPYQRDTISGITDGSTLADLLLGYPDSGGVDYNASQWTTFPTMAVYAQDNWHVSSRLTLNIGLRYDIQFGLQGLNLNRGLCLTCVNPITNNPVYQANLAADMPVYASMGLSPSLSTVYGGVLFAGKNGQPNDAYNTDYTNIGPRFGFAYQLNPKTVIRGGYGIMYSVGLEGGSTVGSSESTPYVASLNGGITPDNYFASGNPFPSGYITPLGAAGGLLTGVGNGASFDFPGRRIPRSQQVSLGIQRELPSNMLLDVRYAGNFNDRLRTTAWNGGQGTIWLNGTWTKATLQQAIADPGLYNNPVPNPFYGVPGIPTSSYLGSSPTIPYLYLSVPWQEFPGPLGSYDDPLGKSYFNSLQVVLNKRLSHNVSFRAAYTYSKTMVAGGYLNGWPYQDPSLLYEIGPADRTHVFSLSGVYDLPMIHADSGALKAVGYVVNHWRLSNVLLAETGFPENLPGGIYNSTHSYTPNGGPTTSQWLYNCNNDPTACWETSLPSFVLSEEPGQISTVRKPQNVNLDLNLQREFPITERWKIQLRGEALNLLNTVLFPGPDTNPNDGPPVKQSNGSWSGFGTVPPFQYNFPRIVKIAVKLFF